VSRCCSDYTKFSINGKPKKNEHFLQIGTGKASKIPKEMYSVDGTLLFLPEIDVHFPKKRPHFRNY
jgi:hypothetical protein